VGAEFNSTVVGERAGRPWPAACALADCALQVWNRVGVNTVMGELTLWQPRIGSSVTPQPSDTLVRVLVDQSRNRNRRATWRWSALIGCRARAAAN